MSCTGRVARVDGQHLFRSLLGEMLFRSKTLGRSNKPDATQLKLLKTLSQNLVELVESKGISRVHSRGAAGGNERRD
jgi:hypothetical protein